MTAPRTTGRTIAEWFARVPYHGTPSPETRSSDEVPPRGLRPRRAGGHRAGPVDGTGEIVRELHDSGVRLIALSNWSTQKFALTRPRFASPDWLESTARPR